MQPLYGRPCGRLLTSGSGRAPHLRRCPMRAHSTTGDEIVITRLERHANIVPWQFNSQRNSCGADRRRQRHTRWPSSGVRGLEQPAVAASAASTLRRWR
ncbi:MAG: aminotransferase class V-fold PLP-dependent enzyme [Mycobacterium sp.]